MRGRQLNAGDAVFDAVYVVEQMGEIWHKRVIFAVFFALVLGDGFLTAVEAPGVVDTLHPAAVSTAGVSILQ